MNNAIKLLEDVQGYIITIEKLEKDKHLDVYDMLTEVQSRYKTLKMSYFTNDTLYFMYKRYNQNSEGEYIKQMKDGLKNGENQYTENKFESITKYLKEQLDFISMSTGNKV